MVSQTKLIHEGERPSDSGPLSLTTPIYETSTFVFDSAADVERYQDGTRRAFLYSRYENPTVVATEEKLAVADGAEMSLAFSSGMAATATALMTLLSAGDEVVCASAIYGGTFHFIETLLPRFGVERRFVSLNNWRSRHRSLDREPSSCGSSRRSIRRFAVSISGRLRRRAVTANVLTGFDNTFASPANQQPLALGIDISMQSATKYLNGHSDVTGGVLSGSRTLLEPIGKTRRLLGGIMDPQPAYALGRGLKTLPLRVARHNANAHAVARALDRAPCRVAGVLPGVGVTP